jgi:transcriptional regulator with XRE-family HTH domain
MKFTFERISEAIKNSNLSYRDIAKLTGIPPSTLQRYASGQTSKIPIDKIELIAKATHVSAAYLMGWDDPIDEETSKNKNEYLSSSFDCELSPHEKALVSAYRNNPAMQSAVDKLLGIDTVDSDIAQDMIETVRAGSSLKKHTNTK